MPINENSKKEKGKRKMCNFTNHLENAIDRKFPNNISARNMAEAWDDIFMDAELEAENCDDCEGIVY